MKKRVVDDYIIFTTSRNCSLGFANVPKLQPTFRKIISSCFIVAWLDNTI